MQNLMPSKTEQRIPVIAVIFPWVVRGLLGVVLILGIWIIYELFETQREVVKAVIQPTMQVRTHQVRIHRWVVHYGMYANRVCIR